MVHENANLLIFQRYKNLVGAGRGSHRQVKHQMDSKSNDDMAKGYLGVIAGEATNVCKEILQLLEEKLIPQAKNLNDKATENKDATTQARIFYLKMAGDYYRYLAEIDKTGGYEIKAKKFYTEGSKLSEDCLPPTDPIRLGLALNLSVCYYEILENRKEACRLAKDAFDQAISKLDNLEEVQYKDATLIMQLLRDNLTLWSNSEGANDDANVEDDD